MLANQVFKQYDDATNSNVLMMFKGGISQNIVADLGSLLQNRLGFDLKVRRMFGIFVEMVQNINNYSAEVERTPDGKEVGVGILLLSDSGTNYTLNSGNLIRNENVQRLKEQCDYLLTLNKAELKAFHEKRIDGDAPEGSKGAGLGLIEITMKSNGNVSFEFMPRDETYSFFSITAAVQK